MKKVAFISLITLIFYYGCSHSQDKSQTQAQLKEADITTYHKRNFDSLMLVDKNLELDYCGELLNDKAFVDIFEHGTVYKGDVMKFISKEHLTHIQSLICLCTMQRLNTNDYINFCKFLLSQFDQGKIEEDVINYAIWSPPEFINKNRIIIDHYDDPNVIKLLESIKDDKKISVEFRKYIVSDALSGKAKKDLEDID